MRYNHSGDRIEYWSGGQRACHLFFSQSPAIVRRYLRHPDKQIRFSAGCAAVYQFSTSQGHFVPGKGYTDEDIELALSALRDGFAERDSRSAGLRRYIAEHFHPSIKAKRLIPILAFALDDLDVAVGSSGMGAAGTLGSLTGIALTSRVASSARRHKNNSSSAHTDQRQYQKPCLAVSRRWLGNWLWRARRI